LEDRAVVVVKHQEVHFMAELVLNDTPRKLAGVEKA
jgi:hypothetical protein